jgi:hypothetical protein
MSSRLPKSRRSGKRMESVKKFFGLGGRQKDAVRKPRRLMIDPLEQRQLLTVSVGNLADHLVNQTLLGPGNAIPVPADTQTTIAGQSMATDHNGDIVVTWTRVDPVLFDPATTMTTTNPITGLPYAQYDPIIDPTTGPCRMRNTIRSSIRRRGRR